MVRLSAHPSAPKDDMVDAPQLNTYPHIRNLFARQEAVAADPGTPAAVLDELARKPVNRQLDVDRTRERVASNPTTSAHTLTWLMESDQNLAVATAVLTNPSTPVEVLRRFGMREGAFYAGLVVENPGAGDEFVRAVVDQHRNDIDVLLRALRNPAITDDLFESLAARAEVRWSNFVDAMRAQRRAMAE